jgi:hypothetical protein
MPRCELTLRPKHWDLSRHYDSILAGSELLVRG